MITHLDGSAQSRLVWRRLLAFAFVGIVFVFLAWRQHNLVDRYAVNMMFWDQWDLYRTMFEGSGWWHGFTQQHGPHRQGLGHVVTRLLAESSSWDSRWDAFGVSFTLIGAAGLGLLLAVKAGFGRGVLLIAVPILYFNVRQYEQFAGPANISHGAMPIFLFTGYCLVWLLRTTWIRLAGLSIITFLLIFTGFGLFVGVLTPLLLLVEGRQSCVAGDRQRTVLVVLAFSAVAVAWWMFFQDYQIEHSPEKWRAIREHPLQLFQYVSLMLANAQGIPGRGGFAIGAGVAVSLVLIAICLWHGRRFVANSVEGQRRSVIIFCLAAFALMYCFNTALGRVFLGVEQARTSRYVTLMIPAGLTIYFSLGVLPSLRCARVLQAIYIVVLVSGTTLMRSSDLMTAQTFHDGRLAWKKAYLVTHDEVEANRVSGYDVYTAPVLGPRLKFLEERKLNLFKPSMP
jgi:hypothetical protein